MVVLREYEIVLVIADDKPVELSAGLFAAADEAG